MTELEDGDDVFLRTDDKIYLQCTRTHENKQGTVSNIQKKIGDGNVLSDESGRSKAGKFDVLSENGHSCDKVLLGYDFWAVHFTSIRFLT